MSWGGLLTEADGEDGDGGEGDEQAHDIAGNGYRRTALVRAVHHV